MEEFGWTIVSGQEGTTLRDGQMKKLRLHTAACQKATDIFKKKRREILIHVRAHTNTRESSLERPPTLPS